MPTRLNGLKVAMLMLDAGKGQLQGMVKVSSALRKNGATDVVEIGCADGSFSSMRQKYAACSASLVIVATMVPLLYIAISCQGGSSFLERSHDDGCKHLTKAGDMFERCRVEFVFVRG